MRNQSSIVSMRYSSKLPFTEDCCSAGRMKVLGHLRASKLGSFITQLD